MYELFFETRVLERARRRSAFSRKTSVAPPIVVPNKRRSRRAAVHVARVQRRVALERARALRAGARLARALARLARQALGFGVRAAARRLRVGGGFARRAPSRRRAHALGVRLRLLRRRSSVFGLRRRLAPFFCGFRGARGGTLRRVFVGRGCLSCIERVFFFSPEHRERYLGRRRPGRDRWRGAAFCDAAVLAVVRKDARRRRRRGRAVQVVRDGRRERRAQPRALHERARQGRPRRPNGARPRRRGSTRARRPRSARRPRRRRERSQRRERAVLALGVVRDRTQQGLSPRALRLRARRRDGRLGGGALGLGGAERALGLFGAARRRIRADRIGVFGVAPARRPPRRACARRPRRLEADAQRAGRAGRTARGPRRGRRCSLC